METYSRKEKNQMLNFIKGIACIGVVFIHVMFPGIVGEIVSKLSQFAVPVFFMIAGYYAFGSNDEIIKRRLFKIIRIFIFAYLCFFCYSGILYAKNAMLVTWLRMQCTWKTFVKFIVFCNIDFAIPLWYLIAMIEIYLVWYIVVRKKKVQLVLYFIPILFLAQVVIITFCETRGLAWFWKTNFLTRALPWFLLGYFIHEKDNKIGIYNNWVYGFSIIFGGGGVR